MSKEEVNVASLKLCKELYERTRWFDTSYKYDENNKVVGWKPFTSVKHTPAYDLGYLLRKLPLNINGSFFELDHYGTDNGYWVAHYCKHDLNTNVYIYEFGNYGDIPEDAVAKLAVVIFKQEAEL